jgi:aconitate decarboxylase
VDKVTCVQSNGENKRKWLTTAGVVWKGGRKAKVEVKAARGVDPELSNKEIVEKWRTLTRDVINDKRREQIEKACLRIELLEDVMELEDLLAGVNKTTRLLE